MADLIILDTIPEETLLELFVAGTFDFWNNLIPVTCFYIAVDPALGHTKKLCLKVDGRYFVGVAMVPDSNFYTIYGYETEGGEMFRYTTDIMTMVSEGFQVKTTWDDGFKMMFHRYTDIQQW